MLIVKNLKIKGSRERFIMLDVLCNENGQKKPLVIFCHGFKGYKDWGHFNLIAETIANAGFVVCKFNFSYNGGTEEEVIDFPDLEAFGHNNISTELNDLGLVIDAWQNSGSFIDDSEVDREQLAIIGHSRGGGVCILKAAEDKRVKQLVSLAAISEIRRMFLDEDFLQKWKTDGVVYIQNGRTKQQMPMYYQYYEDYVQHQERLDIHQAASKIDIPWLIVHGTSDGAVPYASAEKLHSLSYASELMTIEEGDHTFGGRQPWNAENLPEKAQVVIERSIDFLKHHF